jgi:hypothetical protein
LPVRRSPAGNAAVATPCWTPPARSCNSHVGL